MEFLYLLLIPLLLFLAALFAASEASLFSLSRNQLESIRQSKPKVYQRIKSMIFEPDALLSTIIIGNELLNILIGTLIASFLQSQLSGLPDHYLIILSVALTCISLLSFSEILPKVIAFRMPIGTASLLATPMTFAHYVLTPCRIVFLGLSKTIISFFGIKPSPPAVVSEKDFLTLVEVGAESGSLDSGEKEMITNVFQFSDNSIASIMTPWKSVFYIEDGATLTEILSAIKTRRFSRIPVLSKKDNRVVGILYIKELLKLLLKREDQKSTDPIKNVTFPPYIVSAQRKVSSIFRDFKAKKVHIALVVDEFGHHLGILTLEDILNSLLNTQPKTPGKVAR